MRLVRLLTATLMLAAAGHAALAQPAAGKPPEPRAGEVMARITPENIRAAVEKLVSFGTRHTLSETSSDARGIGAARRWIEDAFRDAGANGRLEIYTESFEAPAGPRVDKPTQLVNVIAVLPGVMAEATNRRYYIVAHYDSRVSDQMDRKSDAPGANDDASGVAAVIEAARALAHERLDATVVFLATAGEEQGLLGAHFRASQARADGEDIRAVLNNDIVGDPMGQPTLVRVFSEGLPRNASAEDLARIRMLSAESDSASRQLARYVDEVAKREQTDIRPMLVFRPDRFLRGGDHLAFTERGFPAVRFTVVHEDYARQHQDIRTDGDAKYGDTIEHLDWNYIAGVARLNAATLKHLANAPSTPGNVRIITARLERSTTLRWSPSPEPDVAGYQVVWRDTTSAQWEQSHDAGNVTEITLPLNKDNVFIGVRAYDKEGYLSPVAFAASDRE